MSDAPVFVIGHSLGAARAIQYGFSRLKRGFRLDGIYAFAPPNAGDASIGQYFALGNQRVVKRSYKNRRDLVTDVPVDVAILGEEYVQPWPLTEMDEPSEPGDPWGVFCDHHIELYQAGSKKLPKLGVALEAAEACDLVARLYQTLDGWDWVNPTDGSVAAVKRTPMGANVAVFRGSKTETDWLDDFDAWQTEVYGSRVSEGFWRGVANNLSALDARLAL
jgi:hypothetical protein